MYIYIYVGNRSKLGQNIELPALLHLRSLRPTIRRDDAKVVGFLLNMSGAQKICILCTPRHPSVRARVRFRRASARIQGVRTTTASLRGVVIWGAICCHDWSNQAPNAMCLHRFGSDLSGYSTFWRISTGASLATYLLAKISRCSRETSGDANWISPVRGLRSDMVTSTLCSCEMLQNQARWWCRPGMG